LSLAAAPAPAEERASQRSSTEPADVQGAAPGCLWARLSSPTSAWRADLLGKAWDRRGAMLAYLRRGPARGRGCSRSPGEKKI